MCIIRPMRHNNDRARPNGQAREYKIKNKKVQIVATRSNSIAKTAIKEKNKMASSNNKKVPQAKAAMEKFKMEAANEVGVNLTNGDNGDLTSRQAGSVGGQMVKKMIEKYENELGNKG